MNVEHLPTVEPTKTGFEPVFVYLPIVLDDTLGQTQHTNKQIMDFLKDRHVILDDKAKIETNEINLPKEGKKQKIKKIKKDNRNNKEERDQGEREEGEERDDKKEQKEKDIDEDEEDDGDDNNYLENLPPTTEPFKISGKSKYYMNNRKIFIHFINNLFGKYRAELIDNASPVTCDNIGKSTKMDLMVHQKLIRDYINLYTPYRGLLLIHGLGSGKTCSSIGIAEGFRDTRKIIILTPAYLQKNYIGEIKKCGDMMYRLKQHWEFIPIFPESAKKNNMIALLGLSNLVQKQKGFWLMDAAKTDSNYNTLTDEQKITLDNQLDVMIHNKYHFINYNGSRFGKEIAKGKKKNIFNNSVVIIDEVHNLVSNIVNKIKQTKDYTKLQASKTSAPILFYKMIMEAHNCRIIMLSGTPILNYPNEVAVLFNMLRGYIYTFNFTISDENKGNNNKRLSTNFFSQLLTKDKSVEKIVDYIHYEPKTNNLTVTKNPLGFRNEYSSSGSYEGVEYEKEREIEENITDEQFKTHIKIALNTNNVQITSVTTVKNLALPDKLEIFNDKYLDENKGIKNFENFKRRIVGLVSYFRSADEALLPKFDKNTDIHTEYVVMSSLQFRIYKAARIKERTTQTQQQQLNRMQALYGEDKSSSSYRIESRRICNFVFPESIIRPVPAKRKYKKKSDGDVEPNVEPDVEPNVEPEDVEPNVEPEDVDEPFGDKLYTIKLREAYEELSEKKDEYLKMPRLKEYSPKFARVLENIESRSRGKHLVYSQFRTLEGIGIFALCLEANGFVQFKIKRTGVGAWTLDMNEEDIGTKPMYALYTGQEDNEEREIIRYIFNGEREQTPNNIQEMLDSRVNPEKGNIAGDIIRVFMITASGSEGINLMETRYVHIMEPFWHYVRTEQVIGRARRICSHKKLPLEARTIEVFLYMMQFTTNQLIDAIEIKKYDLGKLPENANRPLTTDEQLYETGQIKERINSKLLMGMKEASIDCEVYTKNNAKEGIRCIKIPSSTKPDEFIYDPNYANDPEIEDHVAKVPIAATTLQSQKVLTFKHKNINYIFDPDTHFVYEYATYSDPITRTKVGKLVDKRLVFDKA